MLLENFAEATVVHDGKVLQQQQVLVQLHAGGHEPLVRTAFEDDVGKKQLPPPFVDPCLSHHELCRSRDEGVAAAAAGGIGCLFFWSVGLSGRRLVSWSVDWLVDQLFGLLAGVLVSW